MNNDELSAAVRESVTGVHMDIPAEQIARRGPPRTSRPAAQNSRSRSRLGSQARAGASRASIAIQAVSSQAMATSSHQSFYPAGDVARPENGERVARRRRTRS